MFATEPAKEAGVDDAVCSWLGSAYITANYLQLPATGRPPLTLVIDAQGAPAALVAATLASYRRGTVQQVPVQICGLSCPEADMVRSWLAHDPFISFPSTSSEVDCAAESLLAVPAGVLFSTHSVEAAYQGLKAAEDSVVLRVALDGAPRAVEIWWSRALGPSRGQAEAEARRAGGEYWVSGASLGLYFQGQPLPKPHLRKGVAGTLELRVVVEDGTAPKIRDGYLDRIKLLEAEVARLRRAQWSSLLQRGRVGAAVKGTGGGPRRLLASIVRAVGSRKR